MSSRGDPLIPAQPGSHSLCWFPLLWSAILAWPCTAGSVLWPEGVSSVTDKLLSCSSVQFWGSCVQISNYLGWRIPPSPTRWIRSGSEQGGGWRLITLNDPVLLQHLVDFFPLVFPFVKKTIFSSVQFSHSLVSDSLRPHELKQLRPPCPSPTPGVHSDSCPSSQWCHPAISSSVVPFSSCSQSLPASESFRMSQLFAWGGQSTGVSASASFLPKKSQGSSPSEWTGWISLQGLSRVFSNTTVQKHQFFKKIILDDSYLTVWFGGFLTGLIGFCFNFCFRCFNYLM